MAVVISESQNRKKLSGIISLIALAISLPLLIWSIYQVTNYLSKASAIKANIVVDASSDEGILAGNWLNFAQGGEEVEGMLTQAVGPMQLLKPKYIRIDHIFDNYGIINENGVYNFEKLDRTVADILNMGAKPFFSLSYMPGKFTASGSIIDIPSDWTKWQDLVKKTVEHYSGRNGKNIANVYYEVWNEPDLPQFGGFKLSGDKNYNNLYHFAAKGAEEAENTNRFFIGGPAVGSFYPVWVDSFISYAQNNNLRVDFYSWHRYHTSPDKFREDADNIRKILKNYPRFANIPLVLSEWGIDSANNQNSSGDRAAAHALATVFKTESQISLPFAFEVKDGPPPAGGKWGLMTHERDVSPLYLKPRFKAFAASTYLVGAKLKTTGTGSNVTAMSTRALDGSIYLLMTNYDGRETNIENVPVTITGLEPGLFKFSDRNISSNSNTIEEISTTDGKIKKEVIMLPNSTRLLEIKKSGNLSEFITGTTGLANDKALILANNNDFVLSPFSYDLSEENNFSFAIKSITDAISEGETDIVKIDLENENGLKYSLNLKKTRSRNIDFILLTLNGGENETRLASRIDNWNRDFWHKINITFAGNNISLAIDENEAAKEVLTFTGVTKINSVRFYPNNFAIDNITYKKAGISQYSMDFN